MCNYNTDTQNSIIYAYTHSRFYQWFYSNHNVNLKDITEDGFYESLPLLNKDDILDFIDEYGIEELWCTGGEPLFKPTTTGTIGKRLTVAYSNNDIRTIALTTIEAFKCWGYKGGPLNGIIFGHPQDMVTITSRCIAKITGGVTYEYKEICDSYADNANVPGESFTFLVLPQIIKLYDTSINTKIFNKIKLKYLLTIVTPFELKTNVHLKTMKNLGNVNLIPVYASSEMGLVGASTPETFSEGLICLHQSGLFQVISREGNLLEEGRGELVYTSFNREAFPFIKYRIGDIVDLRRKSFGKVLKFVTRQSITVKIPDAGGYFIDVLKVDEIVKRLVPECQTLYVYGEHSTEYYLFLSIFIGVSREIEDSFDNIRNAILKQITECHAHTYTSRGSELAQLSSKFFNYFPIFFVDVLEIPKEPGATKPKMFINLMKDNTFFESPLYQSLLTKLRDYLTPL